MRFECCSRSVWAMLSSQRTTGAKWGNTCDYGAASLRRDHPADSDLFMEHHLLCCLCVPCTWIEVRLQLITTLLSQMQCTCNTCANTCAASLSVATASWGNWATVRQRLLRERPGSELGVQHTGRMKLETDSRLFALYPGKSKRNCTGSKLLSASWTCSRDAATSTTHLENSLRLSLC